MPVESKEIIRDFEYAVAKTVLYCVSISPLALGINKTISILLGAKTTFIIERNLYELPVYGIFPTFTSKYLHTVIEVLLEQGLLTIKMVSQYDNLPTLKVTSKGQDFLAGNLKTETPFVEKLSDKEMILLNEEEQELFEALRQLRRRIADKKGLPAYTICHDAILREMSKSKLTTAEKLLAMRGIKEKFVQNYGDEFLAVVRSYVQ